MLILMHRGWIEKKSLFVKREIKMTKSSKSAAINDKSPARTPVTKIYYVTGPVNAPHRPRSNGGNSYYDSDPTYQVTPRVLTIVSALNEKRTKLRYQLAVCAPTTRSLIDGRVVKDGDSFSKARGREIALGRLKTKAYVLTVTAEMLKAGAPAIQRALYQAIVDNGSIPSCARKICTEQLKGAALIEELRTQADLWKEAAKIETETGLMHFST